jgi:hypothetical protein
VVVDARVYQKQSEGKCQWGCNVRIMGKSRLFEMAEHRPIKDEAGELARASSTIRNRGKEGEQVTDQS